MSEASRAVLVRRGLRLEWLSAGWLLIEAAVAIGAAVAAHSLTLLAFGADSVIELLSACVLLWRLNVELRLGEAFPESAERLAGRIGAALLASLALYVLLSAGWGLWHGRGQEFSLAGLALAAVAIPVMAVLGRAKLNIARAIGSGALRADAAESFTCTYLSAAVLLGLGAQWLLGAWWVDSASALVLVPFLVREAKEAWEGEACGGDADEG